jgi:hypothetical protein
MGGGRGGILKLGVRSIGCVELAAEDGATVEAQNAGT